MTVELRPAQTIIVMAMGRKTISHIIRSTGDGVLFSWIYFGKDVSQFMKIREALAGKGKYHPISLQLQKNAKDCRQEFIDYLGTCAAESRNPWWYLTSLSEKNPYVSDLYLNFCYVKTFFDIIRDESGRIYVICEEPDLVRCIKDNTAGDARIHFPGLESSLAHLLTVCRRLVKRTRNKGIFLMRFLLRILIARGIVMMIRNTGGRQKKNPLIIHSWADQRSFSDDGTYTDVYFGSLAQKISDAKKPFFLLINILPTMNYLAAVRKICSMKKPWHLFEEYLTISELWKSVRVTYEATQMPVSLKPLMDLDVSALVRNNLAEDRQNARTALSFLYYLVGKRMTRIHSPCAVCYTFENHTWEKMLIKGIREESQGCRITGYAHSTVNSLELSYSLSTNEAGKIPLPDSILVNGRKPLNVLVSSGFDGSRIHIAGSLRYGQLQHNVSRLSINSGKHILVILSASIDRSLEMISKCGEAFRDCSGFFVIFKPHPIQKITRITGLVEQLQGNFSVSGNPLPDLLQIADVAIYSDSTAAVEAVASGIPVLQIQSDFMIDISIFNESEYFPTADSPDTIRTIALRLMKKREGSEEKFQEAIQDLFSPVDDAVLLRETGCAPES